MNHTKIVLIKLFLCVEIFIFMAIYIFGTNGIYAIINLNKENHALTLTINQLQESIQQLNKELDAWEHDPFLKEKIAREHLQMARKNETVYFLS